MASLTLAVLGGLVAVAAQTMSIDVERELKRSVIIEARPHPALRPVMWNVCNKTGVPMTLFHSRANVEVAARAARETPCVDRIVLFDADNLDAHSYNAMLLAPSFWRLIDDGVVLLFQTDSGICGPSDALAEFAQYDYCGSPWSFRLNVADSNVNPKVGNGGFSIRNSRAMLRLLVAPPAEVGRLVKNWTQEDMIFASRCHADPECAVCPWDVGLRFCVESMGNVDTWAFHNNWKYAGPYLCPNVWDMKCNANHSAPPVCAFNEEVRALQHADGIASWTKENRKKHPAPRPERGKVYEPVFEQRTLHEPVFELRAANAEAPPPPLSSTATAVRAANAAAPPPALSSTATAVRLGDDRGSTGQWEQRAAGWYYVWY